MQSLLTVCMISRPLLSSARLLHRQNFTNLLNDLETAFRGEKLQKNRIRQLLRDYKSQEVGWQPFAHFSEENYTRNLVRESPEFCAIVLTWGSKQTSSIHDHASANCWVKVLDGELTETRFRQAAIGQKLQKIGQATIGRDSVTFMNDELGLHTMANCSSRPAVTLHVYAPPFRKCNAFDETTGKPRISIYDFYSVDGKTNTTG